MKEDIFKGGRLVGEVRRLKNLRGGGLFRIESPNCKEKQDVVKNGQSKSGIDQNGEIAKYQKSGSDCLRRVEGVIRGEVGPGVLQREAEK